MYIRQAVNVCLGRIKRRGSTDVCCSIPGLDAIVNIIGAVMYQRQRNKVITCSSAPFLDDLRMTLTSGRNKLFGSGPH